MAASRRAASVKSKASASRKANPKSKAAKSAAPAAKSVKTVKPKAVLRPPVEAAPAERPRRLKLARRRQLSLKRRPASAPSVKLASSWQLSRRSGQVLWQHRWLWLGITSIYGVLNLLLVQSVVGSDSINLLKGQLGSSLASPGNFWKSLTGFSQLIGSAGNGTSATAGAYQLFLVIMTFLAAIWALRHLKPTEKLRVRDAYYHGMYPLVPFMLVLLYIGLQLLPVLIGSSVYSTVIQNSIAAPGLETFLWGLGAFLLALLSGWLAVCGVFAAIIVTLPGMTPMKAIRSSRDLVHGRRWTILRKLLFLPLILLVVAAVILLPVIVLITPLASWLFFMLTMLSVAAIATYIYALYLELLRES